MAIMETGRWIWYGDCSVGDGSAGFNGCGDVDSGDCGLDEFSEVEKSGAQYP